MSATATKTPKSMAGQTVAPAPEPAAPGLLDQAIEATVARLDVISAQCLEALSAPAASALRRAMLRARAIELLEQAITPEVMRLILKLMNSPAGFLTDRGPGMRNQEPYDAQTVRRCAVEALLAGLTWYDNEFNIISGKLYITLNGYRRKVNEFPDLADPEVIPGTPALHNGHTVVRVAARWTLGGKAMELTDHAGEPGVVFPVSTNASSTADNTTGKAKRKAYKMIFERISGTRQSDDEDEAPLLEQAVRRAERKSRSQETAEALAQKAGRAPEPEHQQAAEAPTEAQLHQQAPPAGAGAGYVPERDGDPEPGSAADMAAWSGGGGKGPYQEGR